MEPSKEPSRESSCKANRASLHFVRLSQGDQCPQLISLLSAGRQGLRCLRLRGVDPQMWVQWGVALRAGRVPWQG